MAYNRKDAYYRKAKQAGYRSRAAYKLVELQRRFHLLHGGDRVVDLGAAPGGWVQVAAESVGPKGKVVGVDLQAIEPSGLSPVTFIQGDAANPAVLENIKRILGGPADSVLSDMAPRLSGIRDADIVRSLELNQTALSAAVALLKPGGALLIKSFDSEELEEFALQLRKLFSSVQRTRPQATRRESSEIYFYAAGFHLGRHGA